MTQTPLRGDALLDAAIDHIQQDRLSWNQRIWAERPDALASLDDQAMQEPENRALTCGCLAHWVAILGGAHIIWDEGETAADYCELDGDELPISDAAMQLLDLGDSSYGLFLSYNSLSQIQETAKEIQIDRAAGRLR